MPKEGSPVACGRSGIACDALVPMCGCKTKLFEISPQRDVQLVSFAVEIENHLTRQGRTNFGGINLILKALLDRFP